jgi:alanine racemase
LASTQQKFGVHTRPNWAEVSLSALAANFRTVVRHLDPEVTACCVIKCDAYGHGVIEVARALEHAGAQWLGVTSTEEGVAVRGAGVRVPILVMTGFWRGEEDAAAHCAADCGASESRYRHEPPGRLDGRASRAGRPHR